MQNLLSSTSTLGTVKGVYALVQFFWGPGSCQGRWKGRGISPFPHELELQSRSGTGQRQLEGRMLGLLYPAPQSGLI